MRHKGLKSLLLTICLTPLSGMSEESNQNEFLARELERANRSYAQHDLPDAMAILRNIADQGYVPGQYQLAYVLDYGEENEEAVQWYTKAAQAGHSGAQIDLALKYISGEGVASDIGVAISWLTRAAAQNTTQAMMILADLYARGATGNTDYEKAVYWYTKAFEAGDRQGAAVIYEAYRDGRLGLEQNPEKAGEWLSKWQEETPAEEHKRGE